MKEYMTELDALRIEALESKMKALEVEAKVLFAEYQELLGNMADKYRINTASDRLELKTREIIRGTT
jgi:hypothetical protein